MPKPWYSIKAAATGSEFDEISILDPISPWYGCDAKTFLTDFRALKASKVRLFISSPGGSVMEALAIFNGMRATNKHIEVHILGVAASAASYIAMAGHKVVMPSNTMMFLHNPINMVYGNADEMRAEADVLDKFASILTATYMKRWKGEEQALKDVLSAESYLSAAECLEFGLCDEVLPEITAEASFDLDMLPEAVRAKFTPRKPPEPEATSGVPAAEVERIATEAGAGLFASILALDASLSTVAMVGAAAKAASEIAALCKMTGKPELAANLVRERKSLADVRALLSDAMVAADLETRVNTAARSTALTGGGADNFVDTNAIWKDYNAMKAGSPK